MNSKSRFFWVYTIILFSIAFVLILFSAFSAEKHQDFREDISKGTQKSISALADENKRLTDSLTGLNQSVEALSSELDLLKEENEAYRLSVEAVLSARELCDERSYYMAQDELAKADRDLLTDKLAELYDSLKIKIENNI